MPGRVIKIIMNLIVWPYLVTFILLAYLVGNAFKGLLEKWTKKGWKPVYTVLIIATLVAVPYLLYIEGSTWDKMLITYAIGTSMYETFIKAIVNFFINKFK